MFDFLEDNLLIICPNSYKLAILKYLNDNKMILNIKFMTKSEYKKRISVLCSTYVCNKIEIIGL